MKIGLYDRWLSTMGGGERYALTIAAHLAKAHAVTVLSHTPVRAGDIAARLRLDLSGIDFCAVPLRPPAELGRVAAQYDLFINASHQNFVPPLARRNALVVFFPARPPSGIVRRIRRATAPRIERWARLPRPAEGVYGSETVFDVHAHGLGQTAAFDLPAWPRPVTVRMALAAAAPSVTGAELRLDGKTVDEIALSESGRFYAVTVTAPAGARTLSIHARGSRTDGPLWLYATPPQTDHLRGRLFRRLFDQTWPNLGDRIRNSLPPNLGAIAAGYDLIWAISAFTQRWIAAYWDLPSTILYPPVDVRRFAPHSKRPQILSVGRFFAHNHNKKHLVMIEQFRALVDAGLTGWELHLAGGSTAGVQHQDYLRRVHAAAQGYPIHIHVDIAHSRLVDLYGSSSIYWHASGYGEDEARHPARFEHFGITAVEAMAAGCAPVLIGHGGLAELVRHGEDGYLWYTTDELRGHTLRLIQDSTLRSRIAQAALVSSRRFDVAAFEAGVDRSLAPLLSGIA